MHEFVKSRPSWAYAWFWFWLALVSAGTLFIFLEIDGLAGLIVTSVLGLAVIGEDAVAPWLETAVLCVAGILLWWRVVKVMVLHGAPLSHRLRKCA